jgi:hypothetical protein
VLRDPHCAVDTTQTVRVLPDQQQRAAIFPPCEQAFSRLCQRDCTHELLGSHHPSYLHSMPADSRTRSRRPFFSEAFSFSISKGPVD